MGKIKILYLVEYWIGGVRNVVLNLAERLDKSKFEVVVCSLCEHKVWDKNFGASGVETRNFRMRNLFDIGAILALSKFIRDNRFHIVHTHLPRADFYGRLVARLCHVPFIFSTVHSAEKHREKKHKFLHSFLDKISMGFANEIIAVAESVKRHIIDKQGIDSDKIVVIRNGIDIGRYAGSGNPEVTRREFGFHNNSVIVGVVGRLNKQKGLAFFLRAACEVLKVEKRVQFLIVGEGPQRYELERLSKRLGIDQWVVFSGFRADVPSVLSVMDIFVMPSLVEGFPLSLLEAMAVGKPVIASNIGGIPEIVKDRESGILVPPRDPEALAEAIVELLKDRANWKVMGENGRQRVIEYFNVERMVRDYEEFYLHHVGEGALISKGYRVTQSLDVKKNCRNDTFISTRGKASDPFVSVVVLNWNGIEDTVECLNSLREMDYPNFETIVVDNGSTDGSQERIKREFPEVSLIENHKNLGVGEGNNVGIRHALGKGAEYIFLLNNDAIVDPQVLQELINVAENDRMIGIAGPLIYFYDDPTKIQSAGLHIDFRDAVCRLRGYKRRDTGDYSKMEEVNSASGCGMLVKKSVIQKVGLLDPEYFAYGDDIDWSLRTKKAGFKVVFVPQAKMWHKGSMSTGGRYTVPRSYLFGRATVLFIKKHGKWYHWFKFLFFVSVALIGGFIRQSFKRNQKAVIAKALGLYHGLRSMECNEATLERLALKFHLKVRQKED